MFTLRASRRGHSEASSSRHTDWQHVVNIFDFRLLLHEGPGPPKSSPEPFKTQFLETFNLTSLKGGSMIIFWRPPLRFWPQFYVLRMYRRAAGGERKAGVNFEMDFLQKFMHHV